MMIEQEKYHWLGLRNFIGEYVEPSLTVLWSDYRKINNNRKEKQKIVHFIMLQGNKINTEL